MAAAPAPVEKKQPLVENACVIFVDYFKDVKVNDDVISFFLNGTPLNDKYRWSITYANGETKESTEKVPQFYFSDVNYITVVKVKITKSNPVCSITVSKKYDDNFWKTRKYGNLEQKVYSPVSYSEYKQNDQPKARSNNATIISNKD